MTNTTENKVLVREEGKAILRIKKPYLEDIKYCL